MCLFKSCLGIKNKPAKTCAPVLLEPELTSANFLYDYRIFNLRFFYTNNYIHPKCSVCNRCCLYCAPPRYRPSSSSSDTSTPEVISLPSTNSNDNIVIPTSNPSDIIITPDLEVLRPYQDFQDMLASLPVRGPLLVHPWSHNCNVACRNNPAEFQNDSSEIWADFWNVLREIERTNNIIFPNDIPNVREPLIHPFGVNCNAVCVNCAGPVEEIIANPIELQRDSSSSGGSGSSGNSEILRQFWRENIERDYLRYLINNPIYLIFDRGSCHRG
jgi:hypothetical protein